jgi:spore photoproduct lyase
MIPLFKRLIIDRRALGDPLTERVRENLAGAEEIVTGDADSGAGQEDLVLKFHEGRFVKDFPVTTGAPPCGEKYIAALQGCPYECSYCYLRSYLSGGAVTLLVNSPAMQDEIRRCIDGGTVRLTTGELSDSLAIDNITGLTSSILPLLEGSSAVLEARTKSSNVGHLPGLGGREAGSTARHLLVTWTLSPPEAVMREEALAAALDERLGAISKVAAAGIGFALRLDPVIPYYWDAAVYRGLLERVWKEAEREPRRIELGVLRFPPGLIERVRRDTPYSPILRGEYIRDREGKMRLYRSLRVRIYREAAGMIGDIFPGTTIELSQEDLTVWEDAGIDPPALC